MDNNYWNDIYWKEHLEKYKNEKLDFLDDIWADKYASIINNIPKGRALDLGAGMGQYTKYLMDKGFDVTSADISDLALQQLKNNTGNTNIICLDMKEKLPFADNSFELVFANLSIHYFDNQTTINLLKEIKRIIKNGGYFIGAVNSSKTYKFIKDHATAVEDNYYIDYGRYVRLWNKEQFDKYFKDFILEELHEVETRRWNKIKILWEFIAKVNK